MTLQFQNIERLQTVYPCVQAGAATFAVDKGDSRLSVLAASVGAIDSMPKSITIFFNSFSRRMNR